MSAIDRSQPREALEELRARLRAAQEALDSVRGEVDAIFTGDGILLRWLKTGFCHSSDAMAASSGAAAVVWRNKRRVSIDRA